MTITYNPNSNATVSGFIGVSTIAPAITGVTAGNTLFLVVVTDGNNSASFAAPSPPTDSNGSGWVADMTESSNSTAPYVQILVYRLNNANSGTHTLSLTVGTGSAYGDWAIFETTPVALSSKILSAVTLTTSSITGPNTGTLGASYGFALGVCASNNSSAPVAPANPNGWTVIQNVNTYYPADDICYQIVSSNTALNPTWTASGSMTMQAGIAFYTDASGPKQPDYFDQALIDELDYVDQDWEAGDLWSLFGFQPITNKNVPPYENTGEYFETLDYIDQDEWEGWGVNEGSSFKGVFNTRIYLEDPWDWDEYADDEWSPDDFLQVLIGSQPPDLDWDWDEECADEWTLEDVQFSILQLQSVEHDWDWIEEVDPDDFHELEAARPTDNNPVINVEDSFWQEDDQDDEWWLEEKAVGADNNPLVNLEDSFPWFEDEFDEDAWVDEYVGEEPTSYQPPEDAWDWDEHADDEWDHIPFVTTDNNPVLSFPDEYPFFDDEAADEWQEEQQANGPDYDLVESFPDDYPFFDDECADEWQEESQPVGPNYVSFLPQSPDLDWDWDEWGPDDYDDWDLTYRAFETNLVFNPGPNFTSTSGWYSSQGLAIVGGEMQLTTDGSSAPQINQGVPTIPGATYQFVATIRNGNVTGGVAAGVNQDGTGAFGSFSASITSTSPTQVWLAPYIATTNLTAVVLLASNLNSSGQLCYLDDFSFYILKPSPYPFPYGMDEAYDWDESCDDEWWADERAPVGPSVSSPIEDPWSHFDEEAIDEWEHDPFITADNNPLLTTPDAWDWDEFSEDDWYEEVSPIPDYDLVESFPDDYPFFDEECADEWQEEQQSVGANYVSSFLTIEDAWDWDSEFPDDEAQNDESQPVGANAFMPVEDAYLHFEDEFDEDAWVDEYLGEEPTSYLIPEDAWFWAEEFAEDDYPEDTSSILPDNNPVISFPDDYLFFDDECADEWQEEQQANGPDNNNLLAAPDPWEWDEFCEDDWQEEQQPPIPALPFVYYLNIEDAYDYDEVCDDEWQEESQPVGANQPSQPQQQEFDWDEECADEWMEEQQPPIRDNNPVAPYPDEYDWDEFADDEWQEEQQANGPDNNRVESFPDDYPFFDDEAADEWMEEQQANGPDSNPLLATEDPWWYDELDEDDWQEESAAVIPNFTLPPLPVEDAWPWYDEDQCDDETQNDDSAPVGGQNLNPVEDAYDWDEVCDDEWMEEQAPPVPDNNPKITTPDAWDHEDFCEDDWQEESQLVVPNNNPLECIEDAWPWFDEFAEDDWQEDEQAAGPDHNPQVCLEDPWLHFEEFQEDDWQEDAQPVVPNVAKVLCIEDGYPHFAEEPDEETNWFDLFDLNTRQAAFIMRGGPWYIDPLETRTFKVALASRNFKISFTPPAKLPLSARNFTVALAKRNFTAIYYPPTSGKLTK